MLRKTLLALCCLFMLNSLTAQISTPGTPASLSRSLDARAPTAHLPGINLPAILKQDKIDESNGLPPRFAFKHKVNLGLKNAGSWTELKDGSRVWRLSIQSEGAKSLNFIFGEFFMPDGAQLFLYNEDRSHSIGAFTKLNNKTTGGFATAPVKGDIITLEYVEPASARGEAKLRIAYVGHAYHDLYEIADQQLRDFGDSGGCNIDVACPNSNGWEDEIRSVAMIINNNMRWCTGSMVNNTAQDGTPYFLTANHCLDANVANWVFVFNYDSPTCGGADGSTTESISGCTLRASAAASDFALLELSMPPPPNYVVYYAGWNRENIIADTAVGIHHPSGDVKKICFDNDPIQSTEYFGAVEDMAFDHWKIEVWEEGVTEPGSSGSALFDQNHHVIGQLHGGTAACGNVIDDFYGKFSYSWDQNGPNADQRLDVWLDPANTGALTIDGEYFIDPPLDYNMEMAQLTAPQGSSCDTIVTPVVNIRNIGGMEITAVEIGYQVDSEPAQFFSWTGSLGFYENAQVILPNSVQILGAHSFSAWVQDPNGNTDMDLSNDTLMSNFEIIDGLPLTLDLTTDNYPGETSVVITDDQGNTVFSAGNYAAQLTQYFDVACLAEGCYTFSIIDEYGDGICCAEGAGSFALIDENQTVILQGGEFGLQMDIPFCLPLPTVGAQILSINSPVEGVFCDDAINPEISFSNLGTNTLNNLDINYSLNGAAWETFNWSGSLAYGEVAVFAFPSTMNVGVGQHELTIAINLSGDPDLNNDTLSIPFNVIDGEFLVLNLNTDDYPGETSVEIADENGNVVYFQNSYENAASLYIDEACLPEGCYTFTIYDAYNDGICCQYGEGNYTLMDASGTVIFEGNGEFGELETTPFCLPLPEPQAIANFSTETNYCTGQSINPVDLSTNASTYQWSMPDATPSQSSDPEPSFSYANPGTYTITLIVFDSNGLPHQQDYSVTIDAGNGLDLQLNTDSNPSETTVSITDNDGNSVFSGTYSDANTLHLDQLCLTDGCYTFSITDANGLSSNGYTLSDVSGTVLTSGAAFSGTETFDFCFNVSSTEEELAQGISVTPNPSQGTFIINTGTQAQMLEVFDVLGRNIFSNKKPETAQHVDLSAFEDGVYMIKLTFNQHSFVTRVVVQR